MQTAERARLEAEGRSTPLVPGVLPSTWLGNVALVQSSDYGLGRTEGADYRRETDVVIRTGDLDDDVAATPYVVDFLAVLEAVHGWGNL